MLDCGLKLFRAQEAQKMTLSTANFPKFEYLTGAPAEAVN